MPQPHSRKERRRSSKAIDIESAASEEKIPLEEPTSRWTHFEESGYAEFCSSANEIEAWE